MSGLTLTWKCSRCGESFTATSSDLGKLAAAHLFKCPTIGERIASAHAKARGGDGAP